MTRNVTDHTRRSRALTALLAARSVDQAAQIAGVSRRTVFRWLEDKEFRDQLKAAEGQALDEAARRLLSGQALALDVLEDIISNSTKDADRRLAAVAWMDLLLRWREATALEDRIQVLEEKVLHGKS